MILNVAFCLIPGVFGISMFFCRSRGGTLFTHVLPFLNDPVSGQQCINRKHNNSLQNLSVLFTSAILGAAPSCIHID